MASGEGTPKRIESCVDGEEGFIDEDNLFSEAQRIESSNLAPKFKQSYRFNRLDSFLFATFDATLSVGFQKILGLNFQDSLSREVSLSLCES